MTLALISWVIHIFLCAFIAHKIGRSPLIWAIIGVIAPGLGLIIILILAVIYLLDQKKLQIDQVEPTTNPPDSPPAQ